MGGREYILVWRHGYVCTNMNEYMYEKRSRAFHTSKSLTRVWRGAFGNGLAVLY